MKKKLFYSCLLLFYAGSVCAQTVDIPDVNFKNALLANESVNTNGDDEIQVSEAEAITLLDISGKEINSLEGINSFVNLVVLSCSWNNLSELDLSALSQLNQLEAIDNEINSISFPATNQIETLQLEKNVITNLDAIEFFSLDSLKSLNLSFNPIGPNLIVEHDTLISLYLDSSLIEEIDIDAAPQLLNLSISFNPLVLDNALASDQLKALLVSGCELESLDVTELPALEVLIANWNNLSGLNLEINTELTMLQLAENLFTSLDVSHLPLLTDLAIPDNQLTELFIKNGVISTSPELLFFNGNPELSFVCADPGEMDLVNSLLAAYGYTDTTATTDCALDIAEIGRNDQLIIYPIPASHELILESAFNEIIKIQLYDLSGKLLVEQVGEGFQANVTLDGLAPAIYLLRLETAEGISSHRIIKE